MVEEEKIKLEILLDETRRRHEEIIKTRDSIDQSSVNMILIIGATIGFLITLSATLLVKIGSDYHYQYILIIILIVGIILNIVAIFFLLYVKRIRSYAYISAQRLSEIGQDPKYSIDIIYKQLILTYENVIENNEHLNNIKSRRIWI